MGRRGCGTLPVANGEGSTPSVASKRNGEGAIPSLSRRNTSGEGSTPSVTAKWEGEGAGPPCCAEMPTERVAPPPSRQKGTGRVQYPPCRVETRAERVAPPPSRRNGKGRVRDLPVAPKCQRRGLHPLCRVEMGVGGCGVEEGCFPLSCCQNERERGGEGCQLCRIQVLIFKNIPFWGNEHDSPFPHPHSALVVVSGLENHVATKASGGGRLLRWEAAKTGTPCPC